MKYIKILFSNGHKFKIPAGIVANSRAKYYATHDEGELTDSNKEAWNKTYYQEAQNTLNDDFEIVDWLWNNMNWEDVVDQAKRIIEPIDNEYDYAEHWNEISENESNVEIVEE